MFDIDLTYVRRFVNQTGQVIPVKSRRHAFQCGYESRLLGHTYEKTPEGTRSALVVETENGNEPAPASWESDFLRGMDTAERHIFECLDGIALGEMLGCDAD